MIPELFLESIRQRLVLSRLIGQRVKLVRKGRTHSGLCPFHQEKTPSFVVDDHRSTYACYGCGARGDVFDYLKSTQGLGFYEAVEAAAGLAGLSMPKTPTKGPNIGGSDPELAQAYALLERACQYFQDQLARCQTAQEYLRRRGVSEQETRQFRLGYAPESGFQVAARSWGYSGAQLEEVGLCGQSTYDGGMFDRFRGRLMFPIADNRGRIVGFGGRALGDEQPKYLNSPETRLFHKGRLLYWAPPAALQGPGLGRLLAGPKPNELLVVVEGYMDALAVSRVARAAAPLGTAVTQDQLQALWKVADQPLICFDGDSAGQRASLRVARLALEGLSPGKSLGFIQLPPGKDPAQLVMQEDQAQADWLRGQFAHPQPLVDVLWQSIFVGIERTSPPEQRARAVQEWKDLVGTITHPEVRRFYGEILGQRLAAQRTGGRPWGKGGIPTPSKPRSSGILGPVATDLPLRLLVGALILDPDLRARVYDQAAQIQASGQNIWLQILADVLLCRDGDCSGLLAAYFGDQASMHLETLSRHLPSCPTERLAYWGELLNSYQTQLYQRQEIAALQEDVLHQDGAWQRLKTLTQL